MRLILNCIMRLIYLLFGIRSKKFLTDWKARIYTAWVRNAFYRSGDIRVNPPIIITGGKQIVIGNKVGLGRLGSLRSWKNKLDTSSYNPLIEIGNNVWIGDFFNIQAANKICIGSGVLMGKWVSIIDNDHGVYDINNPIDIENWKTKNPSERPLGSKGPIIIHDNVWIGDKVTILGGVVIGEGSVIASNAVVTRNIPAYSIAGGVPAKVIKTINR